MNSRSPIVMARPERVIFGLSMAYSSSELMNTRMTSLSWVTFSPESLTSLSYSSSLSSLSLLSALALLSLCVLAFLSVQLGWPALKGLLCCKHKWLTIAYTFSLLLFFKCCFSPLWFKHLFSSGTRSFLKVRCILAQLSPRIILIWFIFCLPTLLCLFFCSLFPFKFQHFV